MALTRHCKQPCRVYTSLAGSLGELQSLPYIGKWRWLIKILGSQYGQVGRSYPDQSDTYLLGLCTGALPAAAIGCSKTLSELLPAAVQTVAVAFRLGLFVMRFRDGIEKSSEKASVWSVLFPGFSVEKAKQELEDFIKVNVSRLRYCPHSFTDCGSTFL